MHLNNVIKALRMLVKRYRKYYSITYHREYRVDGYIDLFDEYSQSFYCERGIVIGKSFIPLKRKELYSEEVPSFAIISEATVGYTNWHSGCDKDIFDKCSKKLVEYYYLT